jgi:hypothetical protein
MSTMDRSAVEWRKSSRSAHQGGECVEVAQWRKSSRSGHQGGDCVEVAHASRSSPSLDDRT